MITDVKRERVAMTREEARRYWTARYEAARKWDDPYWEAQERREHREYVEALRMAIEALSAEDVQGEWIFRTDIPIGGGRESAGYVCSNCRKDYFHVDGMNFCPNCGAKMTP